MRGWLLPARGLVGALALVALVGCGDGTGPVQVGSVAVSAPQTELAVGGTVQLSATVLNTSGGTIPNAEVSWSSANTDVATVSPAGLVTAVAPGSAQITASSGGQSGSVTINVAPPPCSAPTHGSISVGETRSGTIRTTDCVIGETNYAHGYQFNLSSSMTVQIDLVSGDFDALLALTTSQLQVIEVDDDGGNGTNSRLVVTLPAGAYVIWATSFDEFETGNYQLSVEEVETAGCTIAGSISVGQAVSGSLGTGDCQLNDGTFADPWELTLTSQRTVQIDLTSNAFDAYLLVSDVNGNVLAENDDGGTGTNSRLVVTLGAGQYIIWANTFSAGETGSYQLSVLQGSDVNRSIGEVDEDSQPRSTLETLRKPAKR